MSRTTIPNLLNGVSQQPDYLRLLSQAEVMRNFVPHPESGVERRPGRDHGAVIATSGLASYSSAFIHPIDRDATERYRVVILDGDIKVFDHAGTEYTVEKPDGVTYLSAATDPQEDFRAATIADTTVITNRKVTAVMSATQSYNPSYGALLYVRDADFDVNYRVTINGTEIAPHRTLEASDAGSQDSINTTTVASGIADKINSDPTIGVNFTATRYGSAVHVVHNSGSDFTIDVEDGLGGEGLIPIKGTVQKFEDLPPTAPAWFTVKVTGDPETGFDDYYVTYSQDDAVEGRGNWVETMAPQIFTEYDASTLPHVLVRNGAIVPSVVASENIGAPAVSAEQSGAPASEGWATSLNGTESATELIQDDLAVLYSNVDTANGKSTTYTCTYDADFTPLGSNTVDIVFYSNDGVASTTWTEEQRFTFYQADGIVNGGTMQFTTAALDANYDVRVRLEYATAPTGDEEKITFEPATLTYEPTTDKRLVDFTGNTTYPAGMQLTVTVNGTPVNYTPTGDETATQVATAFQPLVDALTNITCTIPTAGKILIEDTSAPPPTVTATTAYNAGKYLITTGLGVSASDLVGDTVENLTDGSSATITSNTDKTLFCTVALTGGVDNTFTDGDICRVVGTGTYFVFRQAEYDNRSCGDNDTNPLPPFVDNTVQDVFFYKDRLGFLTDEYVVLSRIDDLFDFGRSTVTQLVDDDPIFVQAATAEVSFLRNAIHWNKNLIVATETSEFLLEGSPLTPSTGRLSQVSRVGASKLVRPVPVGSEMYFLQENGNSSNLMRFVPDPSGRADGVLPEQVNVHAPTYIAGSPFHMAASSRHRIIAILTDDDRRKVYLYKWFDTNRGRQQSALFEMTIGHTGAEILSVDFVDSNMGLVVKYHDSICFETMPVDPSWTDTTLGEPIHLDRRVLNLTGVYDAGANETTWTLPFEVRDPNVEDNVAQSTFTASNQALSLWTPTGSGLFTTPFDNGSGSGIAPSSAVNPLQIFSNRVQNAKLDGTGGRAVSAGIGVYNNFTVYCDITKAATWGTNGGSGFLCRSNDHRANPEDNTEQMDDGDFIEVLTVANSATQSKIRMNVHSGGNTDTVETGFLSMAQGESWRLIGIVADDSISVYYETTPGDEGTRTLAFTQDLTFGATLASLNTTAHDSFGVTIPNRGNVDIVDNLTVQQAGGISDGTICIVREDTGAQVTGLTRNAQNTVTAPGDLSAVNVQIGVCFTSTFTFSRLYHQGFNRNTGLVEPDVDGNFKIHRFEVTVEDSRDMTSTVTTSKPGNTRVSTVTDSWTTPTDENVRLPVYGRNTETTISLACSTPFHLRLIRAAYEGTFTRRK